MRGVTGWIVRNWMPLTGMAAVLVAANVLRNPITDLQAQIVEQKTHIENRIADQGNQLDSMQQEIDLLKGEQPTAREIKAEEVSRAEIKDALAKLAADMDVVKTQVAYIKGRFDASNAGAGRGEAIDPRRDPDRGDQ